MKFSGKVKILLAGCLLIAASIISFASANALLNGGPAFAEEENSFVSAASVEDASILAGYQVVTPSFIPQDFKRTDISVVSPGFDLPKRVTQTWCADDEVLTLIQDPTLDGIGSGEKTDFCGVTGEKFYRESTPKSPAVLALYWRSGDMAYSVGGTLQNNLDEETLQKVAASIITK